MKKRSGNGQRTAVEKVVKRVEGSRLTQVVENGERINLKTCHICSMLCDIISI